MKDNWLVFRLARGERITDEDLIKELREICEDTHASCNESCPVFALNGGLVNPDNKPFEENRGCDCFKDGREMLDFLRSYGK